MEKHSPSRMSKDRVVHSLHSAHAALNQRTLHEREVLLDVADLQDGGTLLTRNTVVLRYRGSGTGYSSSAVLPTSS